VFQKRGFAHVFIINVVIFDNYFSQVSVATQLRRGGIFNNHSIVNCPQSESVKKNCKIGQYLAKVWTKASWQLGTFLWPAVYKYILHDVFNCRALHWSLDWLVSSWFDVFVLTPVTSYQRHYSRKLCSTNIRVITSITASRFAHE